jgi:hypothetical protein
MRTASWGVAVCLGVLLGLMAACDTAPGPETLGVRPPVLQNFTFSPQRVVFALLPPAQIVGDSVRVPLELSVTALGPERPIEEVAYIVQSPFSLTDPLASGLMQAAGGNRYAASLTLTISALDVRSYTVLVYAVDQARRVSGEVRGQFDYVRVFEPGDPPVIDAVVVPDTVQRPAAGQPAVSLPLIAVVSDPDGPGDVERVVFWNMNTPNSTILLCDDGGLRPCSNSDDSGDEAAGDGRFTRTVFLTSDNAPGVNTFVFQATDRAGLTSAPAEKTVVVE